MATGEGSAVRQLSRYYRATLFFPQADAVVEYFLPSQFDVAGVTDGTAFGPAKVLESNECRYGNIDDALAEYTNLASQYGLGVFPVRDLHGGSHLIVTVANSQTMAKVLDREDIERTTMQRGTRHLLVDLLLEAVKRVDKASRNP